MGFMSFSDFCKLLGIPHKTIDELVKMTPEERQEYYRKNCWRKDYDLEPLKLGLDDDELIYTGEDLLLFWDDRWMKKK